MRKFYNWLVLTGVFLLPFTGRAQKFMGIAVKEPVICYAHHTDHPHYIPPPGEYVRWKNGARTKTANIVVNYNGFTPQAQAAFQYAVDIWAALLQTSQTITIDAYWVPLSGGVLGGALYTGAYANLMARRNSTYFIRLPWLRK